ncbi:hypothetical protein [Caminibacter mediatlanticus]|uniref:Uncharacterized protein n=1 Tax=Caminibacter mediatlanticus TB-2 TaxID=391592 RepID=A0AAI9F1V3_9BACT|nr:hypothetical protein [Caminibacter mediatlanticus]EDM22941.1 hypothetical protein CMTB2_05532 [Caminibacter mediatlanticus TB-2]
MLLNNILSKFLLDIPLLVKGYSNFKIFKYKQEFLLKVGLENIQTQVRKRCEDVWNYLKS